MSKKRLKNANEVVYSHTSTVNMPFHHTGGLDIRLMQFAMSDIRDCFEMLPGDEHITRDHLLEIVEQRIDFLKLMITKSRGEE